MKCWMFSTPLSSSFAIHESGRGVGSLSLSLSLCRRRNLNAAPNLFYHFAPPPSQSAPLTHPISGGRPLGRAVSCWRGRRRRRRCRQTRSRGIRRRGWRATATAMMIICKDKERNYIFTTTAGPARPSPRAPRPLQNVNLMWCTFASLPLSLRITYCPFSSVHCANAFRMTHERVGRQTVSLATTKQQMLAISGMA